MSNRDEGIDECDGGECPVSFTRSSLIVSSPPSVDDCTQSYPRQRRVQRTSKAQSKSESACHSGEEGEATSAHL